MASWLKEDGPSKTNSAVEEIKSIESESAFKSLLGEILIDPTVSVIDK